MSILKTLKVMAFSIFSASLIVFVVSFIQRDYSLNHKYWSQYRVCNLKRIEGAFHLKNGSSYIFGDQYFWHLDKSFKVEDKTPRSMSQFWPQLNGTLINAFNYRGNAYMIANHTIGDKSYEELYVVKYDPLRVEYVAKDLLLTIIPYIKCFDMNRKKQTCLYVPEIKTQLIFNSYGTDIISKCFIGGICSSLKLHRLSSSSVWLSMSSFAYSSLIHLPLKFDSYLNFDNQAIVLFSGSDFCVKMLSCPWGCKWKPYNYHLCPLSLENDKLKSSLLFSLAISVAILVLFMCRLNKNY